MYLNLSLSTKYKNSHIHRKYPPFLNSLEWLTLSCLRGKHHLLLVLLSTTWDQVHEILYHRLSKSRSPGIIQLKDYNRGEDFNCSCTSWGRINAHIIYSMASEKVHQNQKLWWINFRDGVSDIILAMYTSRITKLHCIPMWQYITLSVIECQKFSVFLHHHTIIL